MDNLLRAIEVNWVILVGVGVLTSLLWAALKGTVRRRGDTIRQAQLLFHLEEVSKVLDRWTSQGLPPDPRRLDFNIRGLRAALRVELTADRRKSFWPDLWLNLGTNFFTNLIFFALGVIVTLWTTHPH